jgi:soluble lytic murein transglycosylase
MRGGLVAVVASLAGACGCEDVPRGQGAFCPPQCPPAAKVAPAGAPAAFFGSASSAAAAPPPDPNAWNPLEVKSILEDPRLGAAKNEVDAERYAKGADLLAAALAALPPNDPLRGAWLYQLGKLRALGGNPTGAAKAFEEAAALGGPLVDFAHLEAARWLVGAGQFEAAIAHAKQIGDDPALGAATDLALADAYTGKNDAENTAARLRSYLGRERHPAQWVAISLRLAGNLLQRPSEAHAEEAIALARKVADESPGGAGSGAAKDVEKQALATLSFDKRKAFEHPSSDDLLKRARNLLGSQQSKEALAVAAKMLALPKGKKGAFACDAHLVKADALKNLRKKPEAAEAYLAAVDACAGETQRAEALFNAGRMLGQSGRTTEGMQRYTVLEKEFPKHRLADDARLKGAIGALDTNDEARFSEMLGKMADDYPDGDMVTDGQVLLALHRLGKNDGAGAAAVLEKALVRAPHEHAYFAAGRLGYYLARAHLAMGDTARADAELAKVIVDNPLSFYMALAYARLADKNRALADKAVSDAIAKEPRGAFTLPKGAWLESPIFGRALELAKQGEAKAVKGELDRLGFSTRTASREVMWAGVFLLSKAGSPTMSHALLRSANASEAPRAGELAEWLDHYPVGAWQAPWELAFPRPFEGVVAPAAKAANLPEAWAHAIMREESAFDARVVSPAKAFGLMQLIIPTAKRVGGQIGLSPDEESLKHPEVNVPIGCKYLASLRAAFPDNPLLAIPGYNAGGGAPRKWIGERPNDDFDLWIERIPYEETRNYTKRVLVSLLAYEVLYARDRPSEVLKMPLAASPAARGGRAAPPSATPPPDEASGAGAAIP